MAEAFVAHRTDAPDDFFVLKRVRPEHANSEEYGRRFILEAQVASRVVHPNLARFREFGRVGDCFYIVMRQVRGISLHRILTKVFDEGRLPPRSVAAHLGMGILEGLSALHTVQDEEHRLRPMIHRDVTPKNVIVSEEGEAVLIDFGIAKDVYGPQITVIGQLIGTARYMAPEHRRGEYLDPRADVFSAAVILFELFAGEHPWPPQATFREVLRTTFDPPELSTRARERVPSDVLSVTMKGLQCERELRYTNAAEMSRALGKTSAADDDMGPRAVRRWLETLDLVPDERLATPVLDVRSSSASAADAEVFWTASGFLSSDSRSAARPPSREAEILQVPPLPPRRDEGLEAQDTRELEALVYGGRRASVLRVLAMLAAAIGVGLALYAL